MFGTFYIFQLHPEVAGGLHQLVHTEDRTYIRLLCLKKNMFLLLRTRSFPNKGSFEYTPRLL